MAKRSALPGPPRAAPGPAHPRGTERGRKKPNEVEPDRAEPNEAEPDRAEPNGTERDGTGPGGTERGRSGSVRAGPGAGPVSAMRRDRAVLPVLLLPLLCPVPGGCGSERTTAAGGCCPPCPPAFGVTEPCGHPDTHCQPCPHKEELERTEGAPPGEAVTGVPSPAATPEFVPPEATSKDIIPVYCSLLAAVVVGLLAYVAFKCWHTCRQKKQLAKARAGDLGTSPEGEKLHSDSGVFLDTHSLQEPHQPGKARHPEGHPDGHPDGHPLSSVSPQRQEELERLLESGGPGGDWRGLATRLGFGPDAIGNFGRGRAPARAMLSAWASAEGATLDTLCQALAAIGRHDVARRLAAPGDATSAV
ncbi:death domain-containing membrane protein NRADD-like [Alca torda]